MALYTFAYLGLLASVVGLCYLNAPLWLTMPAATSPLFMTLAVRYYALKTLC